MIKYLLDYDPYSVKTYSAEDEDYFNISEQWEIGISEITNLPNQVGVLKTKGLEPNYFRTFDLLESSNTKNNYSSVRESNFSNGYTLRLKVLDEEITFGPSSFIKLDEPEEFIE